jgi:hypothetical protein
MPSTVYKGDLAEVAFAPETGMRIEKNVGTSSTIVSSSSGTVLTIDGTATNNAEPVQSGVLTYPLGMLVGSKISFFQAPTSSQIDAADVDGRTFTIIKHATAGTDGADGTVLTIHPAMATGNATFANNDGFEILPFCTPPIDPTMTFNDEAASSEESCGIDQFLGIASAITLPETKMDLKRFHVVGLGRDVSVQAPGKFMVEGGSFEVNMHTARWLKYCLGREVTYKGGSASNHTTELASGKPASAGQSHIVVDDAANYAVGKYVWIKTGTAVPVVSDHEPDAGTWDGSGSSGLFDKAEPYEVRRIVAITGTTIHLDEPLSYPHPVTGADNIQLIDYATAANNPPSLAPATGTLTNPVSHLLFSMDTVPSFSLEVSQRRRNVDSADGTADGTSADSKELTRVYRGCKVKDWTLSTDNDAALKLAVNFDSALCYTDTGRLEASNQGSRYNAHRMFDDTADTAVKRQKSGIEIGSQKPFMFYNGSVKLAGETIGQVVSFSLTGNTGVTSHYTINGSDIASASTDQVPFAGARNPVVLVEGQTEYNLDMEIIVDDPIFFHKMRTATEYTNSAANQILLDFNKNGSGGTREKMTIIIDDYYITEAPVQIPEDKGVVKSALKVMPKAIKVVSRDSILKY